MNELSAKSASWQMLLVFLLISFLVFGFGGLFQPGEWYAQLNRAPWSPPNLAFPIVWSILYILIGIAGWLLFAGNKPALKWLWSLQLLLNGLWSWIFFGLHWVAVGLLDIILIDALVINLILKAWRHGNKTAAILLCPYIAWLLLATTLNTYILMANQGTS